MKSQKNTTSEKSTTTVAKRSELSLAFVIEVLLLALLLGLVLTDVASATDPNLVGHWKLDDGTGSTASDETANSNDGTIYGASWVTGKIGGALDFDGSNDYVDCGNDSSLNITGDITITAWINVDYYSSGTYVVAKRDGSNNQYGLMILSSGGLTFYTWGANSSISTTDTISQNSWHHVAVTFSSGGTGELYIDGSAKATDTTASAITTATSNVFIGARGDGSGGSSYNFNGTIDEVMIYDKELSAQEIEQLYNGASLVAHWKLDDSGSTATDETANSNDGTVTGASWTTGLLDGALDFDGSGDYVSSIAEDSSLNIDLTDNDITISAWVNLDKTADYAPLFTSDDRDGNYTGYMLYFTSTNNYAWLTYGDGTGAGSGDRRTKTGTTSLQTGSWYHVVGIIRGATDMSIYIDGEDDGGSYSGSGGDIVYGSYSSAIGRTRFGSLDNEWDGKIDDLRIYDRALSSQEVQDIYDASAPEAPQSQLAGFRAPLLDMPAAPSVFQGIVGQGSSGQGPSTSDPEIQELARALRYDPGLMYKFVHDYIQYSLMWGDIKGPYMTWMDRRGNGFDQASLMIALLEEAEEYSTEYNVTDPNYVVGEIQLSATEAFEWLGIADDPDMARAVLARAGIYGTVTEDGYGDISNIKMEHVWVTVTIDGNDYEFDPSYKSHTIKSGLFGSQWDSAMNYLRSEFLTDAKQGYTYGTGYVEDLNKGNIADDLSTYSTNFVNYIKNNLPDAGLVDVIGGRSIIPVDANALPPSSLTYTVISRDDEFDIDNMPNLYRTSLRIQHSGIDKTFWSSDIYGRRLTLRYNVSNQPELVLDGTVKATGSATTSGQVYDLILSVDHPYDADDFDATTTLNVTAGGFYHIVNGWGDTGTKILEKHRSNLQQYLFDGLSDTSEQVLGESYALVGLTWLAQTSHMRSMAEEIIDYGKLINHHILGVTGQYGSPYIDIALGHLGIYQSVYSEEDPNGIFLTVTGHASAYEHEIIRQLQDCNAVSTVKLLEIANDRTTYDKLYTTDDGNWTTIQTNLNSYSTAEKDLVSGYVDDGFTVRLPQYGDLSLDDYTGIGFQATQMTADCLTASYVISGGYNGGSGADANSPLSPSQVFGRSYVPNPGNADTDVGAFSIGATDLTIGNGGFPFGLSFSRQYSSKRRLEDGPLGMGWTHNFDIVAKVTSDSFQFLGEDSPIDAAPHMVSIFVINDVFSKDSATSLPNNMIASLSEAWLMDQMTTNLVTIKQGAGTTKFTRVPDCNDPNGMYTAPTGQNLKLIVESDDTFLLKNGSGIFYDFNSDGRLSQGSDAHGNVVDFIYTNGKLDTVVSKIGGTTASRWLAFSYTDNHITSVTDSASRSIYYTYDVDDNLIGYTTPDGNDYSFDYDDVNDGQLTKIYSPISLTVPITEIAYDSLGRFRWSKGTCNCAYDYYFAGGYRAERLEPEQTDPNNITARFSTVTWYNEYHRPILTQDQLGRETTYGYDGQLRLTTTVSPSGTSTEYEYDAYNQVVDVNNIVIAGSGESDLNMGNEYDSYENSAGRWFVAKKKHTDPNEHDVAYEYDYDDPNTYGTTVGNLMKITYQQVDAPSDTNRPVETFTYYSDGQIKTKTDVEGMVTKYEYYPVADGAGLKKTIVDYGTGRLNITIELTYDSVGNVATVKDPLDNTTQKQYYASRRLKKTISPSPFSYETTYDYDDEGKLTFVKLPGTSETIVLRAFTYGDNGKKETERGPYVDGNDIGINLNTYTYDNLGRLWKVKDAQNNVTETRYYPDGKVWKVIDALGNATITNIYDPNGILIKVQDAENNATEYEYNGFMGLKKTIYEDGTFTELNYNPLRLLEKMTIRAGETIKVYYDDLRRVKTKVLPDKTIKYKYDLAGRLLETYEFNNFAPKANTTKNTYDTAGRLIKVEYPGDKEVSYEYNAASNRTKLTYPDGSYITYEYDNLGRLTKIRDDSSTILSSYTYDKRSQRTYLSYANGTAISYQYDESSRLKSIDNQTGPGNVHYKYAYTHDKVGNRLSMTFNDTYQHLYTYDQTYQVTDVNYPTAYDWISDTTFNYDAANNRTSVIDGGTTNYTANTLNQYSSVGSISYEYDDNGNLTSDGTNFYTYDVENHLTEVANGSGSFNGPLNTALDNFDMAFTTGGDANFAPVTSDYCDDSEHDNDMDSAESGEIAVSDSSWIKATVNGNGTIKFCWKASSGSDTLKFFIDNQLKRTTWGGTGWQEDYFTVSGLGMHTLEWRYNKNSGSSAEDTAWVDYVRWTGNNPSPSTPLQEALDIGWPVVTDGDTDWFSQTSTTYYGGDAAESGDIADGQVSQMETTMEGAGTLTFWWKVSSESNYDYLQFYLDGQLKDEISGTVGWQQKSYNVTGSGSHSLLWQYEKDGSSSSGSDCGWVDYVQGPGSAPPPPPTLSESLDTSYSLTTGSSADWFGQTGTTYADGDAAESGNITNSQETWLQTTVNADSGEQVSFYWKVSSESGYDYLKFYIDGQKKNEISGYVGWEKKTYTFSSSGNHTLKWLYKKDSSVSSGSDCGWVDALVVGSSSSGTPAAALSEAVDSDLNFTRGGDVNWYAGGGAFDDYYYEDDSAHAADLSHSEDAWMETIVQSDGSDTVSFYWKVSSEQNGDYLEFYIDGGTYQDRISGDVDWQKKTYNITSSGSHALKWRFVRDSSGDGGDDRAWVDFVQWTGPSPAQDPNNWDTIIYKYDTSGRRVEKRIDDQTTTRYVYDGGNVIAEYDGNNNLTHKYIHGARVDDLVCMIDVADNNAVYYYHYDALGSVVALSDSYGNSCQSYAYSIYGQVAASDPNFITNPYMFTGRRFDYETGLYYYRARYYNPYIGRFLQTDPVGYDAGMNLYWYSMNNPLNMSDPTGCDPSDSCDVNLEELCKADPNLCASCLDFLDVNESDLAYNQVNKSGIKVYASASVSSSSSGDACWDGCDKCFGEGQPKAQETCQKCCTREYSMLEDSVGSRKIFVEICFAEGLGDFTGTPGIQPIPKFPIKGIDMKNLLMFGFPFLLFIVLVRMSIDHLSAMIWPLRCPPQVNFFTDDMSNKQPFNL